MEKFNERVRMRGQGGFTLIELLVVIAILAVLGGAVVIGIGALRGNAEEEVCKTDKETIETAAEAAKTATGSSTYLSVSQLVAGGYLKNKNNPDANFSINTTTGEVTPTAGGKYAGVTCT